MENIKDIEGRMQKSVDNLKEEYVTIRAGRANPHILDRLRVDYYGTPTAIQQVANVNVPEPRMIQIQPWEASMVKEIEKAILTSYQKSWLRVNFSLRVGANVPPKYLSMWL